ncbi:hypothetical protein F5884DRAFT_749298 [Xylogone sp. PMI_703]|nr:hypothetical protein F5884DRAFT_749298 [Xylogone sp. PMI_703]
MWSKALTVSFLLVAQASASMGIGGDISGLIARSALKEESIRRYIHAMDHQRRDITTGADNLADWNAGTMTACMAALGSLNGAASNPSGMAACYNIPYLDNNTGVFKADLRLFTISPPTGSFANIPSENVQVSMAYNGATFQAVNTSSLLGRAVENTYDKRSTAPTISQSYAFVGQISSDALSSSPDSDKLKQILTPTITLVGMESSGIMQNTTLSSKEATFVNGVFAASPSATGNLASVPKPIQTLVTAPDKPFVVPGVSILIFPIGGIITGIWCVAFISTVAYGTIMRMKFRENYRRRAARADKGQMARI